MVKHTQTIRRLLPMNCLSVFDHFVGLVLKGLMLTTRATLMYKDVVENKQRHYKEFFSFIV